MSSYGASLFLFKENQRKLREVADYRALNMKTKKCNAPLPRTHEMFDQFNKAKVFSEMDLRTGFHLIQIKTADVVETAFNVSTDSLSTL